MAKTLKQFYDGLSENSKKWIKSKCNFWFDETEPDYKVKYRPVTASISDCKYVSSFKPKNTWSYYDLINNCNDLEAMWFADLIHKRDELNLITDDQLADILIDYMQKTDNRNIDNRSKIFFVCKNKDNQIKVIKEYLNTRFDDGHVPIGWMLYLTEDYDKLHETDLSELDFEHLDVDEFACVMEIFGYDRLEEIATAKRDDFCKQFRALKSRAKYEKATEEISKLYEKMLDVFDRKFFVDNSWTDREKKSIVYQLYSSDYSDRALEFFEEFAREILSVDHKYSKFIYELVKDCPALGNKIYEAKKPDSDINPNDPVEMTFRYSKELRKLGKIANICMRKSLSKANNGFLKDIGSIIRLVGYNFDDIYNMMYPDEIDELVC